MTPSKTPPNRVKVQRQARGWSQAELAERTRISRSGISAIESLRLSPSVEAALELARVFQCSVEDLFGGTSTARLASWAWEPSSFPCRAWLAEVSGKLLAYPVEMPLAGIRLPDDIASHAEASLKSSETALRTLTIATCDPAAQFLVDIYERQSPFRLLVLSRPSAAALDLLEQGLVHAAGVHLSRVGDSHGNAASLAARKPREALHLLRVAQWEEGLALRNDSPINSLRQAQKQSLRWIGRLPGAGARRCQDELLGERRPPTRTARDHRGIAEAIRNEWADAGVCVRLVSDEAHLRFLPMCEEHYDLCYPQRLASDPRIVSLVQTVQSNEYRQLLAALPGYRATDAGEVEKVAAVS